VHKSAISKQVSLTHVSGHTETKMSAAQYVSTEVQPVHGNCDTIN